MKLSGTSSHLVVKAGLSAAPYLLRLDQWRQAGDLLEQALIRDHTTATAARREDRFDVDDPVDPHLAARAQHAAGEQLGAGGHEAAVADPCPV